MIDLRSDTVTRPTPGMVKAMGQAEVGDDVYDEDPSVHRLQERLADLTGHQAALFVPTGSMANLLAVWTQARPGEEVLCDADAHLVRAELGAHASLHGITMRTWQSAGGIASPAQIADLIAPRTSPYLVATAAVSVENTHNFAGGVVQPVEQLQELRVRCEQAGVGLHLDGARLWNAHVASGVSVAEYTTLFDTATLCFSKGLGAPIGSVLVGSTQAIERAREQRKRLGGGWRQAGLLAAAALYAVDHHIEDLADDHVAARGFAEELVARAPRSVDPDRVETNIVMVDTGHLDSLEVVAAAASQGVACSAVGPRIVRAVTHRDVALTECRHAGRIVGTLLAA